MKKTLLMALGFSLAFGFGAYAVEFIPLLVIGLPLAIFSGSGLILIMFFGFVVFYLVPTINAFILFPILWIANVIFFRRYVKKEKMLPLSVVSLICISGLVLFTILTPPAIYMRYLSFQSSSQQKLLDQIHVSVEDEKITRVNNAPRFTYLYTFKYKINNPTKENIKIRNIIIEPGNGIRSSIPNKGPIEEVVDIVNLHPGDNTISGSFHIDRPTKYDKYPDNNLFPLDLYISTTNYDKNIRIYSSSPEWRKIFTIQ